MFEITDEEMELLINNYKNNVDGKAPIYTLKELVKRGLMYTYGDKHYKNGKIIPCGHPFTLLKEHVCHDAVSNAFL